MHLKWSVHLGNFPPEHWVLPVFLVGNIGKIMTENLVSGGIGLAGWHFHKPLSLEGSEEGKGGNRFVFGIDDATSGSFSHLSS